VLGTYLKIGVAARLFEAGRQPLFSVTGAAVVFVAHFWYSSRVGTLAAGQQKSGAGYSSRLLADVYFLLTILLFLSMQSFAPRSYF
jgi:hypothetical protein